MSTITYIGIGIALFGAGMLIGSFLLGLLLCLVGGVIVARGFGFWSKKKPESQQFQEWRHR